MSGLEQRYPPDLTAAPERLRLLTAMEVAERLRVPVSWVRKNGGKLPGIVRIGKYIRWDEGRLNGFISGGGRG